MAENSHISWEIDGTDPNYLQSSDGRWRIWTPSAACKACGHHPALLYGPNSMRLKKSGDLEAMKILAAKL